MYSRYVLYSIVKGGLWLLSNKELAKLYICRRCLNKYTKLRFRNYELKYKYYYYHFKCVKCGGMHHIVNNVKPLYSWKLLLTKRPTDIETVMVRDIEKALKRKQLKEKIMNYIYWSQKSDKREK